MPEPLVLLTAEQLRAVVRDAVTEALAAAQPRSEWVPVAQAGLPEKTLRKAVKAGELTSRRIGRADFVRSSDLERWIASRPERAAVDDHEHEVDPIERAIAAGRLRVVGSSGGRRP